VGPGSELRSEPARHAPVRETLRPPHPLGWLPPLFFQVPGDLELREHDDAALIPVAPAFKAYVRPPRPPDTPTLAVLSYPRSSTVNSGSFSIWNTTTLSSG